MRDEATCCLVRSSRTRRQKATTMEQWSSLSILLSFLLISAVILSLCQAAPEVFTNSFYVRLNGEHGHDMASRIAKRNGFENLGPVSINRIIFLHMHIILCISYFIINHTSYAFTCIVLGLNLWCVLGSIVSNLAYYLLCYQGHGIKVRISLRPPRLAPCSHKTKCPTYATVKSWSFGKQ